MLLSLVLLAALIVFNTASRKTLDPSAPDAQRALEYAARALKELDPAYKCLTVKSLDHASLDKAAVAGQVVHLNITLECSDKMFDTRLPYVYMVCKGAN